jgi:hypothetical protein
MVLRMTAILELLDFKNSNSGRVVIQVFVLGFFVLNWDLQDSRMTLMKKAVSSTDGQSHPCVSFWRMFSGSVENSPQILEGGAIHLQGCNSCPPGWSKTNDSCVIFVPAKMLMP